MTGTPYAPTSSSDRDRDRAGGGGGGGGGGDSVWGIRPVPDPTILTTQQLIREIASLKEVIYTRLDGMDRAIIVFQENLTRVPTDVDKQVSALSNLVAEKFSVTHEKFRTIETQIRDRDILMEFLRKEHKEDIHHIGDLRDEKFHGISTQLHERDVRAEQSAKDSKLAIDAALQAAKESVNQQNTSNALAIAKSEIAMVKQMDQFQALLTAVNAGLDGKISDIKDRLTLIEGRATGAATAHSVAQGSQTQWVGIIGAGFGIIFGIAAIFMALNSSDSEPAVVERIIERAPPESDTLGTRVR